MPTPSDISSAPFTREWSFPITPISCGFWRTVIPPAAIKLAGGAARSRVWVQMFADVCGLPVETVEVNELGTLGAAMSAAVAVGHYRDYHEAAERMVSRGELILPNMENHGIYMEKYQRYAVVARKGG